MKTYKFPENPLEFDSIAITPTTIQLDSTNTRTEILIRKNELVVNDISYKFEYPTNKIYDYDDIIKIEKEIGVLLYKFPENNLGYIFMKIIGSDIFLYNSLGFFIMIASPKKGIIIMLQDTSDIICNIKEY